MQRHERHYCCPACYKKIVENFDIVHLVYGEAQFDSGHGTGT